MEALINWFYDQNFKGVNFNIQHDKTIFSISDKVDIYVRISNTGEILVKLEAQSFINRLMAYRYLAQAYTLEDLGISATTTDAANNWSAWQKLSSNSWQPGTTNIIKELIKVFATNSLDELGQLIHSVYPAEYHSLIWSTDLESHMVSRSFLNNYETFSLVVLLLKNVIQSEKIAKGRANKIYKPRPVYITNISTDILTLGNAHKSQIIDIIAGLDAITGRLNSSRVVGVQGAISINPLAVPKEEELYAIDWVAYELLVCAIQNFTQFKLDSYAMPRESAEKIGDNIQIFRVQYNDTTLAKRFDPLMTQTGKTLFHGSGIANWYSIFYNGLYDGTESGLLLNGAAHGVGIYLSDNIGMSLGYSMGRGTAQNEPVLVGVFQVECADIKTYKQAAAIYVVDKSNVLALRYLIKVNPSKPDDPKSKRVTGVVNLLHAEISALNSYFISDGAARQTQAETLLKSSKGIVRKQKEMQKMFEQQNDPSCGLDYKFDLPDEDNINKWHVDVNRSNFCDKDPGVQLTAQTPLYQDMVACSIDTIQFEITLPDDYPLSPPFIRIITPRFVHLTGHITIGGSICSELLMKQNWVPTLSILKVMIIVCHNMIDGGARLEHGPGLLRPYTFTEAEAAYNRMIRTHGAEWSGGKK